MKRSLVFVVIRVGVGRWWGWEVVGLGGGGVCVCGGGGGGPRIRSFFQILKSDRIPILRIVGDELLMPPFNKQLSDNIGLHTP